MDIARKVLGTYFRDTSFPLIQHHVDSFNDLLNKSIPTFVKVSNPAVELELAGEQRRYIRVFVGGKSGEAIRFLSPVEEDGTATLPHACRLDNRTYALKMVADLDVDFVFVRDEKESVQTKTFKDVVIGEIPLMLRSQLCYLSGMDGYEVGECKYELGGYFIVSGAEKVLMTQEKLGNNMFYAGRRGRKAVEGRPTASYKSDEEYYVGIKTLSEDGARGPFSHFLVIPGENQLDEEDPNRGLNHRLAMIQVSGFQMPVPVFSLFAALGLTNDQDIYSSILADVPDADRGAYDDLFRQLVLSHAEFLEKAKDGEPADDMTVLREATRSKSRAEVVRNIHEMLFSHIEGDEGMFRRKAYALGHMMRMAIDLILGRKKASDRDSFPFKRFETSGELCFDEFKRIYRDVSASMRLNMDARIQYEMRTFAGEGIVNLLEPENIQRYWRGYRMLNEFSKSFKGMWNGRSGVAQELARPSYMAVIHHLRKTDLQIDKTISTAPPRKLYASQFGLTCPIDSPDGSDIGYKKSLTVFARVSTAFPSEKVKALLASSGRVLPVADIHPVTWQPYWTKIYINSDLYGVCMSETNKLHASLVEARRTGELALDVSLAWNVLNNDFKIYCDAGRPVRPVYRAGTTPDAIREAKTWVDILRHIDYLDATEMDTVRISLEPFHPTLPSEIHMTFNLSAHANLVPYADHNPGPRSVFSIAQQKQAASWYHTQYRKRFDTISVMLNVPQRPLSQTWMYREIMGAGGCLPYGENARVAFTVYGGQNQEDSVILNGASLKRGMYRTTYSHAYDISEQMLDPAAQVHTEFMNVATNESVKRKEDLDYSKLDADGIVVVGSHVDDKTVLVGMVSPVTDAQGLTTGYRDVSAETKRGQVGRVDAVYRYATSDGLKGVKIRIVEERSPIVGDKMASRHSQKGTVGLILDEEDMPFNAQGTRPDLIFNPHGIPTRMTVGQFLEAAGNKLGVHIGAFMDATPFTVSNRVKDLRTAMEAIGFEPWGQEVLYNGMTGEQMLVDVFTGPIYYQRLKHMVEDKINYRTTGPRTLLTHQPTQGRGNDGGLRIGEMERDALIAHGMSKFLNESMMERSDKAEVQFNREEGMLDTSTDRLTMPYAMSLYARELESLHIQVKMTTQ